MSIGEGPMLIAGAFVALVLQIGVLIALGYLVIRLATKFLQIRRDIEELKLTVRDLSERK
jgi:hypothetical protein